ncbi:MAG TPA: hypothetical protein PKD86_06745 [Gemmatales bacterium]|nr:hypothetical protein [Gemmatales bacterium]
MTRIRFLGVWLVVFLAGGAWLWGQEPQRRPTTPTAPSRTTVQTPGPNPTVPTPTRTQPTRPRTTTPRPTTTTGPTTPTATTPEVPLAPVPVGAELEAFLINMPARNIGPASMSGRITSLAIDPRRSSTLYAGSASGGLWRSMNHGLTWSPIFEREGSSSVGDVAVAPSDSSVLWVGTGEPNARNSVTWGDGVYQSTDGGRTWKHRGLEDSHHIGRVVIDPRDPQTVYVAALGHFWGPNAMRGIFKTSDGGETWKHILELGPDCGCVDLLIHPEQPDTLIAAAYGVRRDGFSGGNPAMQFHERAGFYKTTDGGQNWTRLTSGLPTAKFGRSGLTVCLSKPNIVYAIIQTERTNIRALAGQGSRENADAETGGVFRSDDFGTTWKKINDLNPRPFYFSKIRVDPSNDQRVWVLGISLFASADGGKTFRADGAPRVHADFHALWIDPANPERLLVGCDGGVYQSHDRGRTWGFCGTLPVSHFFAAAVEWRGPWWVCGGLQDTASWGGRTNTRHGLGIGNHEWLRIGGGDGFYCQVDPTDWTTVYGESQYGVLFRVNVATAETKFIRPPPPSRGVTVRYNWSSPIHLSPHNPRTVYYAGNYLFRSLDRGDNWQTISPDLTRGAPGTITTIAESPRVPGVLWVGTDDGKLFLPREAGISGIALTERLPGPGTRTISRVEPSPFEAATCYVTVDRHRNDDYRPYVYKTTDYGQNWTPLHDTLPANGSVHVIRVDRINRELLYLGTEFGLFVSLNDGANWTRLRGNLPTVAFHDLVVHPRERELVMATHGRGVWIMDAAPLQQATPELFGARAFLLDPKPAVAFRPRLAPNSTGAGNYFAPNPPAGAVITYHLRDKLVDPAKIVITDALGTVMADLGGSSEPGLHNVTWSLRQRLSTAPPGATRTAAQAQRRTVFVPAGDYVVTLLVDGKEVMRKKLRVEADESLQQGTLTADDDDEDLGDEGMKEDGPAAGVGSGVR